MIRQLVGVLASLKLTVALLTLGMVLIFAGTLVQARQGVWLTVDEYFRSAVAWIDLGMFLPRAWSAAAVTIPFPGGLTLGALLLVNLLAAHSLRFKLSWKRSGIVLLHGGLIVLLLGEFVTAFFADEGLMTIPRGQTVQFAEDVREVELAVIDPSDAMMDRVVVFPQSMLIHAARTSGRLAHDQLPFAIEVDRWMPHAHLIRATDPTPADQGIGAAGALAEELPQVRGADGAAADAPAMYVTLYRDDERLGTWVVWSRFMDAQAVLIDQQTYGISMRYARDYLPFALELKEFNFDRFVGTQIARNYSSRVRIIDPQRQTDREVVISMNFPLRYAGRTFYQSSFTEDETGTVLQVVRNPGWLMPYVAGVMVGCGLMWHFVLGLWTFLQRREKRDQQARAIRGIAAPRREPTWMIAMLCGVGLVGLLIAFSGLYRSGYDSPYDMEMFGRLPVSSEGRVKPMDTVARSALMAAGGRQTVKLAEGDKPAVEFLLGLIARSHEIVDDPIVRVDHPDVLTMIGRKAEDGGRVSLGEIQPHWERITQQAIGVMDIPPKQRDPYQRAVLGLYDSVSLLLSHSRLHSPYTVPPLAEGEQWRSFHDAFLDSGLTPADGGDPFAARPHGRPVHPGVAYMVAMMTAYQKDDAPAFNAAVRDYHAVLTHRLADATRKATHEVWFNRANLFVGTIMVYLLAFLFIGGSMLMRLREADEQTDTDTQTLPQTLRRFAVVLLWVGFAVHTLAIVLRIYLQERPPVTNLYSSAIFVGWASVLFGLILERLYPIGMAAVGAVVTGIGTLLVAHNLGSDGDTMSVMQAVLDNNWWLASHVITITLGYSATFLAGMLGLTYLLLGVFTRYLTPARALALSKMVYGVVCFALLLSFVGTVLGGIWADQSWGRFWGWDPKENGAALVVLIHAIILHARWGGLIRQRGMMILAVAGNIITAWSWFGTNMLGVGLHSYGFMDGAVAALMAFVISQLIVMAIGLQPTIAWRSKGL